MRVELGVYIQAGKWRLPGRLFLAMWMAEVTEEVSGGWLPTRSSKVPCRVPGLEPAGRELSRIQKESNTCAAFFYSTDQTLSTFPLPYSLLG